MSWSRAEGRHAWHGLAGIRHGPQRDSAGLSGGAAGRGVDARVSSAEMLEYLMEEINTTTTNTFISRPRDDWSTSCRPGTPHEEVSAHLVASAKRDDAARRASAFWPEIDEDHLLAAGIDWHVFPNSIRR